MQCKNQVNYLPETNSSTLRSHDCKAKGPQNWWSLLSPERNPGAGAPPRKNIDLFWRKRNGERIAETFRGKKYIKVKLQQKEKTPWRFLISIKFMLARKSPMTMRNNEKRRLFFQKHQWWLNDATSYVKGWCNFELQMLTPFLLIFHWSSLIHRKLTPPHPRKVPQVVRDLNNV